MTDRSEDTTVRRALTAGGLVWAVLGAAFTTLVIRAGGDGAAGLVAVMLAFTAGALVASGWLLLAALLDVFAGQRIGRWRTVWTAVVVGLAFIGPMLVMAAQAAR